MESDATHLSPDDMPVALPPRRNTGRVLVLLSVIIPLGLAVFMIGYAVLQVFNPAPTLTITGVTPDPLQSGQVATLSARTAPGASCQAQVFYESASMYDTSSGLQGSETVGNSGVVQWHWKVPTGVGAGPADASITCSVGGDTLTNEASYSVTP